MKSDIPNPATYDERHGHREQASMGSKQPKAKNNSNPGAQKSAAGNRRNDNSGAMTEPGVDSPPQQQESADPTTDHAEPLPAKDQSERSPSQENL